MDEERYADIRRMVQDAIQYDETVLAPARTQATRYYKAEPFGDEVKGRSQVVLSEVRDTVQALLPDIMKVFFGAEQVVEFPPVGPEDEAEARQKTDYVNYVIQQDNAGFLICYHAIKDALIRKMGVIKWWWEDAPTSTDTLTVTDEQLMMLEADPDVVKYDVKKTVLEPNGMAIHTCEVTVRQGEGRARFEAIPPEEFVRSPSSRSLDSAPLVAHRRELTHSELRALGVPQAFLDEHGNSGNLSENEDAQARQPLNNNVPDDTPLPELQKVLYVEAYVKSDGDDDDVAELRRVCMLGTGLTVVVGEDGEPWDEPWPERPFALYIPDPEPHTLTGQCPADWTMDIQNVKSHILRHTMDSLVQTLHPRQWGVENKVNMLDLMNTELGATIRMKEVGSAGEFVHQFVGQAAFPMLAYLDEVKAQRTGQSKSSEGLDPDALQSSTRAGVMASISAAQQRKELLCRMFAETGHTQLMRGLATLLHRHQPKERMVRLRNEWVPVDPRTWNSNMDTRVNVALGTGQTEQRLQVLGAIATQQKEILEKLGMQNPLTTLGQLSYTLGKMVELGGYANTTAFFNQLPADFQPPPQPPKPTPEELLAQIEQMKVQAEIGIKQAELALKREQMMLQDDRERDKTQADIYLRAFDSSAKTGVQMDDIQLKRLQLSARSPSE